MSRAIRWYRGKANAPERSSVKVSNMDLTEAKTRLAEDGYCILEGLLDPKEAQRLDTMARPLIKKSGYAKLEGALNHIPDLAPLCTHPAIMEIAEQSLGDEFYIANNVCMMWCQPGAPSGGLHSDWPAHRIPRPLPKWPMLLQTMWMLTDFTKENGATRVVPGSHLLGKSPGPADIQEQGIPAVGSRGSVLMWHNALWHQSGANTSTDQHRMGANIAYIPWVVHRPLEDWPLVRRDVYDKMPNRLQKLLNRSVERCAFTLIELLVVIGIIAVIIAMLLPSLNKARKSAQATQCLSNLHQIMVAMYLYDGDSKGIPPVPGSPTLPSFWAVPLDKYVGGDIELVPGENGAVRSKIFICPTDPPDATWTDATGTSVQLINYFFNFQLRPPVAGAPYYRISQIRRPAEKFVVLERWMGQAGPNGIQSPWQYQYFAGMLHPVTSTPTPEIPPHKPYLHLACADGHAERRHFSDRALQSQMLPPPSDVWIMNDRHWAPK